MSTTETKCPTCNGPALDRGEWWETCWSPAPVSADASARIAHERANRLRDRCHQMGAEINVLAAQTEELRAENAAMRETLQGIADADWRTWEELASPHEFIEWAKSRARHALLSPAINSSQIDSEPQR